MNRIALPFALLTLGLATACKPLPEAHTAAAVSASLANDKIYFSGDPEAKIATCDSATDAIEPLVKESATATWKSAAQAEKAGVYILDGEFEVFEPNPGCDGTEAELVSVTSEPIEISKTVQVPAGWDSLGEERLAELKEFHPETELSPESLIPIFKTMPARYAKVDFDLKRPDGTIGEHFLQEFEIK